MTRFEYTAIPAPLRVEKNKDSKNSSGRYAAALTTELNRMAADGWEYVRADVLPSEERSGLTGRVTVYHNLLIFRKETEVHPARKNHRQQAKQPMPVAKAEPVEKHVDNEQPTGKPVEITQPVTADTVIAEAPTRKAPTKNEEK